VLKICLILSFMSLILPKDVAEKTNKALKYIEWMDGCYIKWGRPPFDIKSDLFWEMIFDIIKVWEKAFPRECANWEHDRLIDLRDEKSLSEMVKKGLKKRMAYPPNLFKILKAYWPTGNLGSKEFTEQFMRRFPIFKNSNYS